jgi:CDP-diacylglycerol--glycerol-3-phosphate 3-phosphatidyltransferase
VNVPNKITLTRLFLSIGLFVLLEWIGGTGDGIRWVIPFALFTLAAGTDWIDGYLARRLGQVTAFGRILDPLADKVVISGVLILTLTYPETRMHVPAWLVLLVVGREFLVSGLRGYLEGKGEPFGAGWSGKAKFFAQAIFCGAVLLYPVGQWAWVEVGITISFWATVLLSVGSAAIYIARAARLLVGPSATL